MARIRKTPAKPADQAPVTATEVNAFVDAGKADIPQALAPATPLPSTFAASTAKPGANVQASTQAFAAYRLPASLIA